jgi:lysophospholipase L1-like esterase
LRTNGGTLSFGTISSNCIAANAVTYAKIQNVTQARLLGRFTASDGVTQEISIGSGLALNSGTGVLSATGGGGGMTDPMTTNGDIIIRAAGVADRLGIGTAGQVLTVNSGLPSWQNASSGFANPMTTNGDMIIQASGVPARLAVGPGGYLLGVSTGSPAWTQPVIPGVEEINAIGDQFLIWDLTNASRITLDGSNLQAYNDLGSGNNDISIASSGARPPYFSSGGSNNQPYVQVLSGDTFGVSSISVTTTPVTFYVLCQLPDPLTDSQRVFAYNDVGGENGPVIETDRIFIFTGVSPFYGPDHQPAARTQWMVLKVIMKDSNSLGLQVNDEPEVYTDTGGGSALTLTKLLFDYAPGIKISEVRGFSRLITEGEQDRIEAYFMHKYKLEQPEVIMLAFGDSHTLGVQSGTATGGYIKRLQDNTVALVYNFAGSGAVMDDWGNGAFTPYSLKAQSAIYAKPKWNDYWVQFQFGTNDAANETGLSINWATWKANYKTYIDRFKSAGFKTAKMMICTPPLSTAAYVAGNLTDTLDPVREIADEEHIHLCDFYQAMQDEGLDIDDVVGGDDIHGDDTIHILMEETQEPIIFPPLATAGGGTATPAGADTNIQYNDGGLFGADAFFNRTSAGIQIVDIGGGASGGISLTGSAPANNQMYVGAGFLVNLTSSGAGMSIVGAAGVGTSGNKDMLLISNQFAPTSGTATFNTLTLEGEINQTGGANGITSNLKIDPTLTAAADYRAIRMLNASGRAISQENSGALNTFAGDVVIGDTAMVGAELLRVNGDILVNAIKTANPSGGTAGTWKLGILVNDDVVLNTGAYLQVDVGGTAFMVALMQAP